MSKYADELELKFPTLEDIYKVTNLKRAKTRGTLLKLKHGNVPDSKFNSVQLRMGIKIEMEHTTSKSIAKQIAKAHLVEDPKYYTHLKKMEVKYK